jgi:hypothetical protein
VFNGGVDDYEEYYNETYVLDLKKRRIDLMSIEGKLIKKLDKHSGCVLNNTFYIASGYDPKKDENSRALYSISLLNWKQEIIYEIENEENDDENEFDDDEFNNNDEFIDNDVFNVNEGDYDDELINKNNYDDDDELINKNKDDDDDEDKIIE